MNPPLVIDGAGRPAPPAAGCSLEWGGHRLVLLPQRAVWLPQRRMLLVADIHLGKALAFRRRGVPVPHGTTGDSLGRLGALLRDHAAQSLVVLGDLLHSADAQSAATQLQLRRWRDEHGGIGITLVRGNHDDRAGDPAAALRIDVVDEPWRLAAPRPGVPQLALAHHPRPLAGCQLLAGHEHPAIVVGARARDRLRLPCFHFRAGVGVLPAFGSFTGMHDIERGDADRVFGIAGDSVREL